MSGIEVAGLVLGGFPILIAALDKWKDGAEKLQDWWQIKREYRKCLRDIEYQALQFERNLEECLLPLIANEDQLKILIEDAGGDSWKAPELEESLTRRLSDRAYRSYLATISDMKGTMLELQDRATKIEFDDLIAHDHEANQSRGRSSVIRKGKSKVVFEAKRVNYTFDKSTRTRLLRDIDDGNKRLRELLAMSDRVNGLREANKSRVLENNVKKAILQFWQHANSIFESLSEAWSCACKGQHHTSLLLKHRMAPDIDLRVRFFFGHEATASGAAGWQWQEAEVKMLESSQPPKEISIAVPAKSIKSNGPGERLCAPQLGGLKTASSAPRKPNTRPNLRVPSTTYPTAGPKPLPYRSKNVSWMESSKPPIDQIIDLCSTIAACKDSCFGCLRGQNCHYFVCPVEESAAPNDWSTISLETLLSKDCFTVFDRRQRYFVAFTLASSHLQLHSSRWLGAQWSKSDIIFPLDRNSNPVVERIYMSTGAASSALTHRTTHPSSQQASLDRTFSTLGIILLELCFGVAFEDTVERRRSMPADGPNPFSDLGAAFEWSNRVAGEAGPEYAEAVTWCLSKISSFTRDDHWRRDLLEKVVAPLEGCYQFLL